MGSAFCSHYSVLIFFIRLYVNIYSDSRNKKKENKKKQASYWEYCFKNPKLWKKHFVFLFIKKNEFSLSPSTAAVIGLQGDTLTLLGKEIHHLLFSLGFSEQVDS